MAERTELAFLLKNEFQLGLKNSQGITQFAMFLIETYSWILNHFLLSTMYQK